MCDLWQVSSCLSLSFLLCKMGIVIMSIHKAVVRPHCKGHATCPKSGKSWTCSYLLSSPTYRNIGTSNHPSFSDTYSLGQTAAFLPHSHHTILGQFHSPGMHSFPSRLNSILYKLKYHFSNPRFPFYNLEIILPHAFTISNIHSLSTHDTPGSQRPL